MGIFTSRQMTRAGSTRTPQQGSGRGRLRSPIDNSTQSPARVILLMYFFPWVHTFSISGFARPTDHFLLKSPFLRAFICPFCTKTVSKQYINVLYAQKTEWDAFIRPKRESGYIIALDIRISESRIKSCSFPSQVIKLSISFRNNIYTVA